MKSLIIFLLSFFYLNPFFNYVIIFLNKIFLGKNEGKLNSTNLTNSTNLKNFYIFKKCTKYKKLRKKKKEEFECLKICYISKDERLEHYNNLELNIKHDQEELKTLNNFKDIRKIENHRINIDQKRLHQVKEHKKTLTRG